MLRGVSENFHSEFWPFLPFFQRKVRKKVNLLHTMCTKPMISERVLYEESLQLNIKFLKCYCLEL